MLRMGVGTCKKVIKILTPLSICIVRKPFVEITDGFVIGSSNRGEWFLSLNGSIEEDKKMFVKKHHSQQINTSLCIKVLVLVCTQPEKLEVLQAPLLLLTSSLE